MSDRTAAIMALVPATVGWKVRQSIESEVAAMETDLMQHAEESARSRVYAEETRRSLGWALDLVTDWVLTDYFDMADYEKAKALVGKNPNPVGLHVAAEPSDAAPPGATEDSGAGGAGTRREYAVVPKYDDAALRYILDVYTGLHLEAVREDRPFVEVSTGNFPHFLTGLRGLLNRRHSQVSKQEPTT